MPNNSMQRTALRAAADAERWAAQMPPLQFAGPSNSGAEDCERILRSVPQWFGIEKAVREYAADSERFPTFFAMTDADQPIAFLTAREHFPKSWEVHCMAVQASHRNRGIGRCLHEHVEAWLVEEGAEILQVKTLALSHPSPEYAETRRFYERIGYTALEVFPELWGPTLPVLQMVKPLGTRGAA